MRIAAENISKTMNDAIVVYLNKVDGKIGIVVASSTPEIDSAELAKFIASELGGTGGGGSRALAQAGGVAKESLASMLDKLKTFLIK
jgi:alanyl-tRNA synthetase